MSLALWNPLQEMDDLLNRYKQPLNSNEHLESGSWLPVVDISEDDGSFIIKAEIPGVAKDNITIDVKNGVLTIKGEKKIETTDNKIHRTECSYGSFVRSFTLPQDIKIDEIEAEQTDGIITINIPKSETHTPKQIDIKVK